MARKTTRGRKAATDRQSKQPHYYYDGRRKQVKLRTTDVLHEKLLGTRKTGGMNRQDHWDAAGRWFLKVYRKKPDISFEAATRGGDDWPRIYWIDIDVYNGLKVIAEQRNVPLARVIHTAAIRFAAEKL